MAMAMKMVAAVLLCSILSAKVVVGYDGERREEEEGRGRAKTVADRFLLEESEQVVKTEAGSMRVVKGVGGKFVNSPPMHIGFITMEPKSLLIPHYLDSNLIIFVNTGEARVGSIYKDDLVEQLLTSGDVYSIQAGSPFYLVNTAEGQILHIICSIDTSESLNWHDSQFFFIGGGTNPTSVLSGFDRETLATAFNVSGAELDKILGTQRAGPIVYLSPGSSVWSRFLEQEKHEKLAHLRRMVHLVEEEDDDARDGDQQHQEQPTWSLRNLLLSVFGDRHDQNARKTKKSLDSYNLYTEAPGFKNNYGWSIAVDRHEYKPLKRSGVGVYLVNLTAGSMMAPHVNPTATEYGVVLRGSGTVQIVYPNGTLAMNAEVSEGDVFWVPRYFAFCQIASRMGPFEFFGFTTSAHRNRPQFLVGSNSLLQTMRGPEFAASFGLSEERFRQIIDAQHEGVILPSASSAPPRFD